MRKDKDPPVKAIVQKVVLGKHGPYAVTTAEGITGSITVSLDKQHGIWREPEFPEEGAVLFLSDIREKRGGWRAHRARPSRLEDKKAR